MKNRLQGFTLIELMIVVAIIGIIAAIAYPSYIQYVVKGKRSAAESLMLDVANREKQYLLDARAYTGTLSNLGITSLPNEVSANYTVAVTVGSAPPSFIITATPQGGQATNDTKCANLTLDDTGAKGITGTGSVATCW
jgi:type IV pilus assembly protein PilE